MFDITLRRSLVALAIVIGLLFVARPAGADQGVSPGAAIAAADPQVCMAGRHVSGSGSGTPSALSSHTGPSADGIIAVLIGL